MQLILRSKSTDKSSMLWGFRRYLVSTWLIVIFIGCTQAKPPTTATNGRISPTYQGPSETPYCSNAISYSDSITVTGTAQYQAREPYGNTAVGGLGGPGAAKPIRYAEVRVTNGNGGVVQCAETLADGSFSFQLPRGNANYTVSINSRASNSRLNASVLDAPERGKFYSLSATVNAAVNVSTDTLTATVDGKVLGGAFNILDQLLDANEYLRTQASTCAATFSGCQNFSVAPKVTVFWEKGFNPGSYYGEGPVSYYVPGFSRLFILGGVNGDVNSSDTDHFDNSIILHEYGHFIEDVLFTSDSPGGSHNGNKIIDPRLAWSEGWGNFLQAAVRNDPHYIDTIGNSDGVTDFIFYLDLETAAIGNDLPTANGEGNFREFSVTRLLWDALDNTGAESANGASDNIDSGFMQIWAAMTKTSNGWLNPNAAFRAVGLFHLSQIWLQTNSTGTDWSNLRTIERHRGSTQDYAQYVVATGAACGSTSLTPQNIAGDNGSFATSDLFRNNDFYQLHVGSAGGATLTLTYQDADGVGTEADLDLYLYNENARLGVSADWVGKGIADPDKNAATAETETITVSNLGPGNYLINVFVYTGGTVGGAVTYELRLNGSQLCPTSLP